MKNPSALVKKALRFATEKHKGQYRKGGKISYIKHPIKVALGVQIYTKDEEVISAALLHDVLEDCSDVSSHILQKEFGSRVAQLVNEISTIKTKRDLTWKRKKKIYLEKIKKASRDALIIVAVDKMHNLQAYFDDLKIKGGAWSKYFGGTSSEYKWYYTEVETILSSKLGKHPVVKDYSAVWQLYKNENL